MKPLVLIALCLSWLATFSTFAKEKDKAFVPFYFSTESLGHTLGVAGVAKGVGQPQAALFGMALYTDKDSYVASSLPSITHFLILCLSALNSIKRSSMTRLIT